MRIKNEILADIVRSPVEDAHRYEYADAIEAKDPEYANYIREEVAFASAHPDDRKSPPNAYALEARIAQPFLQFCYDVVLYRGFVVEVTIDPYVFIDRGHELLEIAPIQKVMFSTKPVPPELAVPHLPSVVPSPIPELMSCPLLDRLAAISFTETLFQWWYTHPDDIEAVLASRYLSRMVLLDLPPTQSSDFKSVRFDDYWRRAFARPEFRKMLRIDLPGSPAETTRTRQDHYTAVTEACPMPELGRMLEREHGYLPALHLANRRGDWTFSLALDLEVIFDAQRNKLPLFPVGAPVTEEMYAPLPAKRSQNASD